MSPRASALRRPQEGCAQLVLNDRTALLRAHRQGKRGPKIAKAEREQWRAEAGHCLFQKAEGSKGRSVETWGGLAGPLRALRSVLSSQEATGWGRA